MRKARQHLRRVYQWIKRSEWSTWRLCVPGGSVRRAAVSRRGARRLAVSRRSPRQSDVLRSPLVRWQPSDRDIPSRFPPVSLFERVADASDPKRRLPWRRCRIRTAHHREQFLAATRQALIEIGMRVLHASVRAHSSLCAVCTPSGRRRQAAHLTYVWNGTRITSVFEKSALRRLAQCVFEPCALAHARYRNYASRAEAQQGGGCSRRRYWTHRWVCSDCMRGALDRVLQTRKLESTPGGRWRT